MNTQPDNADSTRDPAASGSPSQMVDFIEDEVDLDEFVENVAPGTAHPVTWETKHRARTQKQLAILILVSVFLFYAAALFALIANWWTAATFKEVALALGAPLGLATAVAGFFFGSGGGEPRSK